MHTPSRIDSEEWLPPIQFYRDFLINLSQIPFFIGMRNGEVLQSNQAFQELIGLTSGQIDGYNWKESFSANGNSLNKIFDEILDLDSEIFESMLMRADGTSVWVKVSFIKFMQDGKNQELYCFSLEDINRFKEQESKNNLSNLHDSLTELPNKGMLIDRLKKAIAHDQKDANYLYAVISIDLDDFKTINESIGYSAGDALLIEIAGRLCKAVRTLDTVSRVEGDEFLILLESINDLNNAYQIVDRIFRSIGEPFQTGNREIRITASLGVVLNTSLYRNYRDILRDANRARVRAKQLGKNRYVIHNSLLKNEKDVLEFQREFRNGISRGEFFLVYQPIVDLMTYKVVGLEALLRWNHPQRGMIFPDTIIPAVVEAGLIETLSDWTIKNSIIDLSKWNNKLQNDEKIKLHLNISEQQVRETWLNDQIEKAVQEAGIARGDLCLEFLRRTFESEPEQARERNSWVSCMGASLVIDDLKMNILHLNFFFNLSLIPFDMVKIDKSVIEYIVTDRNLQDSLRTFINIFSSLGISLVAKGVESMEQLKILQKLKCMYAQGNLFSPPLDQSAIDKCFFNNGNSGFAIEPKPASVIPTVYSR